MSPERASVWLALERERAYQDAKFPHGSRHQIPAFLLIMRNELAEAEAAWTKSGDYSAMQEILQVVAVGIAAMEVHGICERPGVESLTAMLKAKVVGLPGAVRGVE